MGVSNIKIQGTARYTQFTKNFGVVDQGEFTDSSINAGSVSNATFAGNAVNTGIVLGNATFRNNAVNTGPISGSAIFYEDSINLGGTINPSALAFVDNPDPYFNNTSLLLNGNSAASANNIFIDSSTNNIPLTASVNSIVQSTFTPFSTNNWSTYFNGSTTYITLSDSFISAAALSGIGTGKTTFEWWLYPLSFSTSAGANTTLMGNYRADAVANRWYFALTPSASLTSANVNCTYLTSTTAESSAITTSFGVKISQWNHVAVTIDATTPSASIIEIFINGVKSASRNNNNLTTHAASQSAVTIGGNNYAQNFFHGYMSNLRVTKNQILYTTDFTPSVNNSLTTTSQGASSSNVILLTCKNKTRLRNEGSICIPFTITGPLSTEHFNYLSTNFNYNGLLAGGSIYFNGSTNLSFNSDSRFAMGTNNFTIDMWIYPTAAPGANGGFLLKMGGGTTVYDIGISINASLGVVVNFWPQGLASPLLRLTSTNGIAPLNTWTHVAVVRSGTGANQTKLYINGIENQTGTLSNSLSGTGTGFVGSYATYGYTGYISNLRAVRGTAVYNSNFNPPSTLTTAISGTVLMLNFTNGGIIDRSNNGIPLNIVGDTKFISTETKYNARSLYFDGTGDYITTFASSAALGLGTENFTTEFWIYPLQYGSAGVTEGPQLIGTRPITGERSGYSINLGNSTTGFRVLGAALNILAVVTTGNGPALSAWSHMAVVRNGTNLSIYKNGIQVGTSTIAAGADFAGDTVVMGRYFDSTSGATQDYRGYLSDIRITKGVARYTTTFNPPSASLPAHN